MRLLELPVRETDNLPVVSDVNDVIDELQDYLAAARQILAESTSYDSSSIVKIHAIIEHRLERLRELKRIP